MTLRIRRILFYCFIVLFLVLSGAIVAYAQGWRLDLETLDMKKVGAIYVRSFPPKAKIYLNDRPVKNESWFFQNGTLLDNLFPKHYRVKLVLDGYHTWHQTVEVIPSFVSEVKYAVLISKTPEKVLAGPLSNFFRINNELVTQDNEGALTWRGRKLPGDTVVGATDDAKRLLTKDSKTRRYFWNNLEDYTKVEVFSVLKKLKVAANPKTDSFFIDKTDSQKLLFLTPTRLSLLEVARSRLTSLENGAPLAHVAASRFWFAWTIFDPATERTTLVLYDKFLREKRVKAALLPRETSRLLFTKDGSLAVLQSTGDFYIYDIEDDHLRPVASDVRDFFLNAEGTEVALLEHGGLEVISFRDQEDYWRIAVPDVASIQKLSWYRDSFHLFLYRNDAIQILDLGDTRFEHLATLAETPLADYDPELNILYFLSGGNLFALPFAR